MIFLFLLSLPLKNPWVGGDGVGYYAYSRSLVVNHKLQFEEDWLHANPNFYTPRIDRKGHILADQYTSTGHLADHFAIGPALIWVPFLAATHLLVLGFDHLGGHIPANGFSWPYLDTMALITVLAGFVGLFISLSEFFRDEALKVQWRVCLSQPRLILLGLRGLLMDGRSFGQEKS